MLSTDKQEILDEAQQLLDMKIDGPAINLKTDCGAKGDGVTNDTKAFQKAAQMIMQSPTKSGKLFIPKGTYIVGIQNHVDGKYPYYQMETIFDVKNVNGLAISGEAGTKIKIADGLRFGSFDKDTGKPIAPKKMFVDGKCAARLNMVFAIRDSKNVIIHDLEIDGNIDKIIKGGRYGDAGTQLQAYGIWLMGNSNVVVKNIYTHHNALDGLYIGQSFVKGKYTDASPITPHYIINVKSEYNARQAFSLCGGKKIMVIDSAFNHTGRAAFRSPPTAGVDIEAESGVIRNVAFLNCEFINNMGCGVVADIGDIRDAVFTDCTMWGTTNFAIWNKKPGFKFIGCKIYGSIVWAYGSKDHPEDATKYINCYFEDKKYHQYGVYRFHGNLIEIWCNKADNVVFDNCQVVANKCRSFMIQGQSILKNCTITHKYDPLSDKDKPQNYQQAGFYNVKTMENVTFKEDIPKMQLHKYFMWSTGLKNIKNVFVEGPTVRWQGISGRIGKIPDKLPGAKK